MQSAPSFDKKACERRIADAFVQSYLNSIDKANYEFVCRPDEDHSRNLKLPDFEYRDLKRESVVLIELGILTAPHKLARKYRTINDGFKKICKELERERSAIGEFWFVIPYGDISKRESEKWEEYFRRIKGSILRRANTMRVGDREVIDKILLMKYRGTGHSWLCPPPPLFTDLVPKKNDWFEETVASVKKMAALLNETGEKFVNYQPQNNTNFLLLLHRGYELIRADVNESIKWIKAGVFAEEHSSLPVFSGLFEVDVVIFDPFEDEDITMCSCYPYSKCFGLCSYSQMFKDTDEKRNCLEQYFPV